MRLRATFVLFGFALLTGGFVSGPACAETFESGVMIHRDMIYKSLIITSEEDLRYYAKDSKEEKVWDEYLGFTELLETIARLKRNDPLYPRKREQLFRVIRSFVGKAPPQEWADKLRHAYKDIEPY